MNFEQYPDNILYLFIMQLTEDKKIVKTNFRRIVLKVVYHTLGRHVLYKESF